MKMYITTSTDADGEYTEYTSSASDASKARTRLKKRGHVVSGTEEVDVPTTRTELIKFLNGRYAHHSASGD